MAVEVRLPRLGQGMESGRIVRWLKAEGEEVAKGEALYELDTDKVTQEVEAEASGVLLEIVVSEGEVDVGSMVAIIGAEGEDVSELLATAQRGNGDASGVPQESTTGVASASTAPATPAAEAASPPPPIAPASATAKPDDASNSLLQAPSQPSADVPAELSGPAAGARGAGTGGRVKASPLARRIARERGIDLAAITATGPDGRVIAVDVEDAAAAPTPAPIAEPVEAPIPRPAAIPVGEVEIVQLTSTRRTIARRLTEAWEAPVFQLTVTADATQLVATRTRLVELIGDGDVKPTVGDLITRLVAAALVRHRPLNAQFVDGRILRYPSASIGLAVAAPAGLVVPVIRDADRKSVQEIAAARADVVSRAREGKLQIADFDGGTFTISNLGMYGIEQFVAVLNPPQVAILAVGSIDDRPVVVGGEIVIAPTMSMTLTCDHRAIDGSEGADFLRTVKQLVETPALAL